jgi:hypothetical protein
MAKLNLYQIPDRDKVAIYHQASLLQHRINTVQWTIEE